MPIKFGVLRQAHHVIIRLWVTLRIPVCNIYIYIIFCKHCIHPSIQPSIHYRHYIILHSIPLHDMTSHHIIRTSTHTSDHPCRRTGSQAVIHIPIPFRFQVFCVLNLLDSPYPLISSRLKETTIEISWAGADSSSFGFRRFRGEYRRPTPGRCG